MSKNKIITVSLLLGGLLLTYNYPVKKLLISSLFGESRGDHFHSGIDFARDKNIYPIKEGDLLFFSDQQKNPLIPNLGTGNLIVLAHENDMRSYYYHLEKIAVNNNTIKVKEGQKIAEMGNSGRSSGKHLHLTTFDNKKKRVINPYTLLPKIEDKKAPKIINLFFRIKNKTYKIKKKSKLSYFGPIEIIVIAGDYKFPKQHFLGNNIIGLKRLTLYIDELLFKEYKFNFLTEKEKEVLLSGKDSFEKVYGLQHNYKMGIFEITEPKHKFEIIAEDKNGNISKLERLVKFKFR